MRLWRISNYADLSGLGGMRAGGRWHTRGRPVVYLAEHPSLALLEVLVHLEIPDLDALPTHYQLLAVDAPDDLPLPLAAELPAHWRDDIGTTRAVGDTWLAQGASALLAVPSAVVPHARNVLLNPLHPDAARLALGKPERVPFDPRLFKAG